MDNKIKRFTLQDVFKALYIIVGITVAICFLAVFIPIGVKYPEAQALITRYVYGYLITILTINCSIAIVRLVLFVRKKLNKTVVQSS